MDRYIFNQGISNKSEKYILLTLQFYHRCINVHPSMSCPCHPLSIVIHTHNSTLSYFIYLSYPYFAMIDFTWSELSELNREFTLPLKTSYLNLCWKRWKIIKVYAKSITVIKHISPWAESISWILHYKYSCLLLSYSKSSENLLLNL